MLYIVLKDRLGNNLFQYAAALSLSSEVTICVPDRNNLNTIIKYKDVFFKGVPIIDRVPDGIQFYEEPHFRFSTIPYEKSNDLIVEGHFQSYRYLDRDRVLDSFSIPLDVEKFINDNLSQIVGGEYTSIHVRRGDYLRYLYKHPICPMDYYRSAIRCIGESEKFIVISDDIQWCKKNFSYTNMIFAETSSPLIDLFIPSFCKNNIISNSSFGWWGAYLNNNPGKKVIAPKLWFGFASRDDTADLLPPSYTIINCAYSAPMFIKAWAQFAFDHLKYRCFS